MTNKETIDRWAEQIIPAVFRAEDALQKAKPGVEERLKNVTPENGHELAEGILPRDSDHHRDAGRGLCARRDDRRRVNPPCGHCARF